MSNRNLGPQFIPEEWHDWVWEATLQPDLDQEYTRKDGEPELRPGHIHFDKSGYPYIASSSCSGRHNCPESTKKMRENMAMAKWLKSLGLR